MAGRAIAASAMDVRLTLNLGRAINEGLLPGSLERAPKAAFGGAVWLRGGAVGSMTRAILLTKSHLFYSRLVKDHLVA